MTAQTPGNAPFFVPGERIVLTRNGVWLADGVEITHDQTRKLFARSLKKDAQGWYLQVGYEAKRVEIEDTPYFVQRIEGSPATGYELHLNDETSEPLRPETLSYRPGRLACQVKAGVAEAKFLHAPYFDLLRELEEDAKSYFLTISGKRVTLGSR